MLRAYEATLPQHNIPLAGDTYFYRILLRLSLNSSSRNWRVRLISECRRARHSYGGGSTRDHRHEHQNACATFAAALDEGRAGQKRRQRSVLRSARGHPKRARSLSRCPAPLQSCGSRRRSFSASAGRQSLVTFHDGDTLPLGSDLRQERSSRVVCEGVGCSRSRDQSPERAAILDALRGRELQGEGRQSSERGMYRHATGPRSRELSPQRVAVQQAVSASPGRNQGDDRHLLVSAHKQVQVGEATERAAPLGTNELCDVPQEAQQAPLPVYTDTNFLHPHCGSRQECLDSPAAWAGSGDGGDWEASDSDSLSQTALADPTRPGCGDTFEPAQPGKHGIIQQLRPSPAAGSGGEADTGTAACACRLHCRLCRLRDLSPHRQDTAHASTCGPSPASLWTADDVLQIPAL